MPDQDLREWVAGIAATRYPELDIAAESVDLKLIHAADRSIYRIDLPRSDLFLVLKIWLDESSGAPVKKTNSSVVDEFERTLAAFEVASRAAQSPPHLAEPLAVSESRNAIILAGCSGEDFSKYLNRVAVLWPLHRSDIVSRFRLTGDWLGRFHHLTVEEAGGRKQFDLRRSHLVRMLSVLENKSGGKMTWDRTISQFDRLLDVEDSVQVALLHGNYALRNLLVTPVSVSAIDFEDSRSDCIYYDLGQLIAEILVRGFIPTFTRSLIDEFRRSVLDGYAKSSAIQGNVLSAYVGYHLVAFYYEHVRRESRNPLVIYRRRHVELEIQKWLNESASLVR